MLVLFYRYVFERHPAYERHIVASFFFAHLLRDFLVIVNVAQPKAVESQHANQRFVQGDLQAVTGSESLHSHLVDGGSVDVERRILRKWKQHLDVVVTSF